MSIEKRIDVRIARIDVATVCNCAANLSKIPGAHRRHDRLCRNFVLCLLPAGIDIFLHAFVFFLLFTLIHVQLERYVVIDGYKRIAGFALSDVA